jgi:hypothetical protein
MSHCADLFLYRTCFFHGILSRPLLPLKHPMDINRSGRLKTVNI